MRSFTTLLLVLCFFVACAFVGYVWGYADGSTTTNEDITAACVRDGHFEYMTHGYVCDLDTESKARVFGKETSV